MKRRLSPGADSTPAPARRGRQPQVSCDFCRQKKIKCGPQRPCLNCLTRSLHCDGGVTTQPGTGDADSPNPLKEIQERLRRLEQAVFSSTEPGPPLYQNAGSPNDSARPSSSRTASMSPDLDYPEAPDALVCISLAANMGPPLPQSVIRMLISDHPAAQPSLSIHLPGRWSRIGWHLTISIAVDVRG